MGMKEGVSFMTELEESRRFIYGRVRRIKGVLTWKRRGRVRIAGISLILSCCAVALWGGKILRQFASGELALTGRSSVKITNKRPLVFYHMMKTGGTTMRHDLGLFAKANGLQYFLPGFDGLPSTAPNVFYILRNCQIFRKNGESLGGCIHRTASSDELDGLLAYLPRLSCSTVVGMHIGPFFFHSIVKAIPTLESESFFATDTKICDHIQFDRQRCVTILRDPLTRMVSHYYHFLYPNSNQSFSEAVQEDNVGTFTRTGGETYINLLAADSNQHSVDELLGWMAGCDVGTYEKRDDFITHMNRRYHLNLSLETWKQHHSREERTSLDVEVARSWYSQAFQDDQKLYDYASSIDYHRISRVQFG